MAQLKRLYFDTAMSGEIACSWEALDNPNSITCKLSLSSSTGAALMFSWCSCSPAFSQGFFLYLTTSIPWIHSKGSAWGSLGRD